MTITIKKLKSLGACSRAREVFEETYGRRAPMTVEAAVDHAAKFDWWWAANHLLEGEGTRKFIDADEGLQRQREEETSASWERYSAARDDAAGTSETRLAASARHDEEVFAARSKYLRSVAGQFAELYIGQEEAKRVRPLPLRVLSAARDWLRETFYGCDD